MIAHGLQSSFITCIMYSPHSGRCGESSYQQDRRIIRRCFPVLPYKRQHMIFLGQLFPLTPRTFSVNLQGMAQTPAQFIAIAAQAVQGIARQAINFLFAGEFTGAVLYDLTRFEAAMIEQVDDTPFARVSEDSFDHAPPVILMIRVLGLERAILSLRKIG